MCELYGFSGIRKKRLNKDLEEFFSHSNENPDGWGLATFSPEQIRVEKGKEAAHRSEKLKTILQKKIEAPQALAHIRLATIGYEEYHNSHPFWGCDDSGRMWTLVHNGTIFEGDSLGEYVFFQKGSTDSERIYLYLIHEINRAIHEKNRPLTKEERFQVLERIAGELSPKNKLNLLIYDGDLLYVHSNFKESLYQKKDEEGVTFSTKPLDDGNWETVPFARLLAFEKGSCVFTGKEENAEYIPDEKSIRALYLAYSGL